MVLQKWHRLSMTTPVLAVRPIQANKVCEMAHMRMASLTWVEILRGAGASPKWKPLGAGGSGSAHPAAFLCSFASLVRHQALTDQSYIYITQGR